MLASSVLESPTPGNTQAVNLNPENGNGVPPIPTPTPGVAVIQLSPFGVISGVTPLPTPTILVADLFFQSSPGMYSAAVAGHKPGDTYWGELPGNPGVYGWITVTGTGMMV